MSSSKTSTWVAGTVVVCLLIAVAAWFLVLSPRFQQAGLTNAEAEGVEQQNVVLQDRVTTLAKQFEEIETFRAELASLRAQVPADDQMSEVLRMLDGLSAKHGVTLLSAVPGTAVDLVPDVATVTAALGPDSPVTPPPAPAPTDATDATDGTAPDTAAPAPAPAPTTRVVSIPLTLTVVGGYGPINAFIDELQQSTGRLVLVPGVSVVGQRDGEESGGRPATVIGDAEAVLTTFLYAVPVDEVAPPAEGADDGADPLPPTPDPGRNPLVPVG